jgi:hypothetical protein
MLFTEPAGWASWNPSLQTHHLQQAIGKWNSQQRALKHEKLMAKQAEAKKRRLEDDALNQRAHHLLAAAAVDTEEEQEDGETPLVIRLRSELDFSLQV